MEEKQKENGLESEMEKKVKFSSNQSVSSSHGSSVSYDSMVVNPDLSICGDFELISEGDSIEFANRIFIAIKKLHRTSANEDRLVYLVEEDDMKYVAITNAEREEEILKDFEEEKCGFPKVICYSKDAYQILICDYCGENLVYEREKMNIEDIVSMLRNILIQLSIFTKKKLCHRNISPRSICRIDKMTYTLVGLYFSEKIGCRDNQKVIDKNPHYCSPSLTCNKGYSSVDDLVSLVYVALFLLKGKLEWENDILKISAITENKKDIDVLKNVPEYLEAFVKMVFGYKREETPDYEKLLNSLKV